ncbi:MAG: hypothetical protein PUJ68_00040 [[Actinobacillus] rossii]|nr:hypothetical protein [[Actinobacillus] rossii]MDY5792845.1 hypothetical protein [[Actinobacillus] rossii]
MYFYCNKIKAFLVDGIHEIHEDTISVSDEEFEHFIELRNKGSILYVENGKLHATSIPPSVNHEWDGSKWVIDQEKQAAYLAQKQTQLIDDIDNKAASIYSIWTRFESEYRERKDAALAFQAENYQGEVSRYITDFAQKANLDNKTATDIILQQAQGLEKLQVELANQRMRKYELKRDGLSLEEMQAIHDDIIQQMNNLAEAYQNG